MYWSYGNDSDESSDMGHRVLFIINKIKILRSKNLISIEEGVELETLRKELDEIRKNCSHSYVPILLFLRQHSYCRYCDAKDYSFKP